MIPYVNQDTKNNIEEEDLEYEKNQANHVHWYHHVLLNRALRVALALLLVSITTPLLIYHFAFYSERRGSSADGFSFGSCLVPRVSRLPCGLGNVTAQECHLQCCYDSANDFCFHRFPSRFSYIMDQQWTEDIVLRPRIATVPFKSQNSLTNIKLSLDEVSSSHLTITYYNSAELSFTGRRIDDKDYFVEFGQAELNLVVNSYERTIFNTIRGPLIAADNIWEIAFQLTNETMYGFGEIPIKGETIKIIYNHKDGMSSIPLIYAKNNVSYHGLLVDTVDPTEVTFREDNIIVIRSITNFGLKFHVFVGPKPADIMNDVRKFIGSKNDLQYWMLGAHVCTEYDEDQKSTAELNNFIREAATHNLPFESHCVMPVVIEDACEIEPTQFLTEGAILLRTAGKRFIPHVSPYIRYETLIENESNETMFRNTTCNTTVEVYKDFMLQDSEISGAYVGSVGNYEVVYPNYENISVELMEILSTYTENIDGIILENSWPLDEAFKLVNETKHYLPYFNKNFENAFNHTPQWNATDSNGERHLHVHNEYGNHFHKAFSKINDVPTWTSSQWMNGNIFINRQNIATSWSNFQKELTEAALGGISGHWHWTSPICGDTDNFDSETHLSLCVKWYMAATYLPMISIHSKGTPRDPLSFQGTHRNLMINALKNRMTLGLYFYTTLQEDGGSPLLRPMFYQFPESEGLKDLTNQFSVGDDLIIVPNLQPDQAMIHMWMPPGVWYELWSGLELKGEEGTAVTMTTTEADLFTAIRGGAIIVLQKDVKQTAEQTRSQSKMSLTIALNCNDTVPGETNKTLCHAEGKVYITENITIHFFADNTQLNVLRIGDVNSVCEDTEPIIAMVIEEVNVYGLTDTYNNYDDMRRINTDINLCELNQGEIQFEFVNEV